MLDWFKEPCLWSRSHQTVLWRIRSCLSHSFGLHHEFALSIFDDKKLNIVHIHIQIYNPVVSQPFLYLGLFIFSAHQQDEIGELGPLRSHLRLMTEECDRKIQARWGEEQTEIETLKREKQQLQKDIEATKEKEKAMQTVVRAVPAD